MIKSSREEGDGEAEGEEEEGEAEEEEEEEGEEEREEDGIKKVGGKDTDKEIMRINIKKKTMNDYKFDKI